MRGPSPERKLNEQAVLECLYELVDPELGINVVNLGLVESIYIGQDGHVDLILLVTSPGCPLKEVLEEGARRLILKLPEVSSVKVTVVESPPWTPDRISPDVEL